MSVTAGALSFHFSRTQTKKWCASITITNQQTSKQDTAATDVEGRYTSLPLPPGEYRVDAGLQGFRRAARSVTVQINATVVIDFTLEVGELTDEVEVRADATLLETSSGTVGKLVDNRRILELPLNTRNVYSLIFLTPGGAGTIGNNYNSMSYSVNGARPTMMDTVIDGVTASFPTVNGFTGRFDRIGSPQIAPGKSLAVTYGATGVLATVAYTGDANVNGNVGFDDLLSLAQHYNQTGGAIWGDGDFSGDGNITFSDLLLLAKEFGKGAAGAAGASFASADVDSSFASDWALAQSLAPEPAMILGLTLAGPLLRRRRARV